MTFVLALTVGGSCAPIITAARDYSPDYVCFIVTTGGQGSRRQVDGPGKPCGWDEDKAPNIVTQLGLSEETYLIQELASPDNLPAIYTACRKILRKLQVQFPEARYVADYTGGSKSMGVGLAMAAVESGWELSLVRGQRPDLIRVADGTEMASLVNSWEVRARQRMSEARHLFNAYAYASASDLLTGLLRQAPVSPVLNRTIRNWVTLCRGFDAWDRFDHETAGRILKTVQSQIVPQWIALKKLTGQIKTTGYEPVLDLVRNAERRAARGRFDDAVARLYRAVELLGQIRLRERTPSLDSGALDLEKIPSDIRSRYERMREINQLRGGGAELKLGLMDDYKLLAELKDPLGVEFSRLQNRLLDALKKRNYSILAHGSEPLDSDDYADMYRVTLGLIKGGLDALDVDLTIPQFPCLSETEVMQREANQ